MTKIEIKHKEEVMQLNALEDKLTNLIGKTANTELMEAYNEWQEQRNVCNSVYNDWLAEVFKNASVGK